MSRPEAPIDHTIKAVGHLADYLRVVRDDVPFTNAELAVRLGIDISTVRRAASGRVPPPRRLVEMWVQACNGDLWLVARLWKKARYEYRKEEHRRRTGSARPYVSINPDLISNRRMLAAALAELYEQAGAPTLREMAARGGLHLPATTAHRIIRQEALPATEEQMRAYLDACEVKRPQRWVEAWKTHTVVEEESRRSHHAHAKLAEDVELRLPWALQKAGSRVGGSDMARAWLTGRAVDKEPRRQVYDALRADPVIGRELADEVYKVAAAIAANARKDAERIAR